MHLFLKRAKARLELDQLDAMVVQLFGVIVCSRRSQRAVRQDQQAVGHLPRRSTRTWRMSSAMREMHSTSGRCAGAKGRRTATGSHLPPGRSWRSSASDILPRNLTVFKVFPLHVFAVGAVPGNGSR